MAVINTSGITGAVFDILMTIVIATLNAVI